MKVEDIPVDLIDVGERRRMEFGDIAGLAEGIGRVGLLEPILVERNGSNRFRLVFGERRLRAIKLLERKVIAAQLREHLTDEEFRAIELEENDNRKALTQGERSRTFASAKKLVENARKAAGILGNNSPVLDEKRGRGQPPKPDSTRAVAAALGVDKSDVRRAEKQVETAEKFPFMKAGKWRQSDTLRIAERIEELPEAERERAAGVLGCAKLMDPDLAVELMENLGAKPAAERQEIYRLSVSADPRDQSLALTKVAELPPMPDPRLGILDNVARFLNAAITPYPNDPLTPKLIEIRRQVQTIRAAVKEVSYDAQRQQQKGVVVQ
jgi:hypothetical protein